MRSTLNVTADNARRGNAARPNYDNGCRPPQQHGTLVSVSPLLQNGPKITSKEVFGRAHSREHSCRSPFTRGLGRRGETKVETIARFLSTCLLLLRKSRRPRPRTSRFCGLPAPSSRRPVFAQSGQGAKAASWTSPLPRFPLRLRLPPAAESHGLPPGSLPALPIRTQTGPRLRLRNRP